MNQEDRDDLELRAALEPHWFRVEARHWSVGDSDGDHLYSQSELKILRIPVTKHTPKGVWLYGGKTMLCGKLVRREYIHRGRAYAAPTIDQAKADFRKRKQFRINCLQHQINVVEKELKLLDDNQLRIIDF